jgi:hypothetical protein
MAGGRSLLSRELVEVMCATWTTLPHTGQTQSKDLVAGSGILPVPWQGTMLSILVFIHIP